MKKTPWFPANIKPVHVGVYETKSELSGGSSFSFFRYWDGHIWSGPMFTPWKAFANRKLRSAYQAQIWRGLATKPKG